MEYCTISEKMKICVFFLPRINFFQRLGLIRLKHQLKLDLNYEQKYSQELKLYKPQFFQ